MNVLVETSAGYSIFKVVDKDRLKDPDSLAAAFATPEEAQTVVKLKAFRKFEDSNAAVAAMVAINQGTLDPNLKALLQEVLVDKDAKAKLAVIDSKLGGLIKDQLGIKVVFDDTVLELMRGLREHAEALCGISENDRAAMRLGLSHSLGRYTLKFSPDKVDVMIIQAIALLDELDKELNTYAMRVREWYGWHFPEMGKIVTENLPYARTARKLGVRTNASKMDLSDVLPEDIEKELKEAAEMSMGTEVADEDIDNIRHLCDQVINISEYRTNLFEYLKNRMAAIAPNLTVMVGELVGARLIAHAGSLLSLAKHPASTVQILGAEKALFRALKTKHDTPKYGLIYHASLVGQAAPKLKGKMARVVAAKAALATRVDALGDTITPTIGLDGRGKVEARLRQLEGGKVTAISGTAKGKAAQQKFTQQPTKEYNPNADSTMDTDTPTPAAPAAAADGEKKKKSKKDKKEAKAAEDTPTPATEKKKKGEKRKREDDAAETPASNGADDKSEKKKHKKQKTAA